MNWNYFYIALRLLFVLLIVIIGAYVIYFVARLTVPFIIATIIAFLMNPLVNLFNRKAGIPRGLSVIFSLFIIFGIIVGLITLFVVEMISGFSYLTKVVPEKVNDLIDVFERFFATTVIPLYDRVMSMFHGLNNGQKELVLNNIQKVGKNLAGLLGDFGQNIVTGLTHFVTGLPSFIFILVFTILGTFFISKKWNHFGEKVDELFPDRVFSSIGRVYHELKRALIGFLKAQLILISITAAIDLVGLLILRVDYAFTIAVVTGVVDLLPYLGTGIIFVPWIIYLFFTGNYFLTIGLSILYAVILIQRQLTEPKIISSHIGLDPLATLIATFVSLQLFGFLGLIIGPVTLVIIKTLHRADVFRDVWGFIIGKNA